MGRGGQSLETRQKLNILVDFNNFCLINFHCPHRKLFANWFSVLVVLSRFPNVTYVSPEVYVNIPCSQKLMLLSKQQMHWCSYHLQLIIF